MAHESSGSLAFGSARLTRRGTADGKAVRGAARAGSSPAGGGLVHWAGRARLLRGAGSSPPRGGAGPGGGRGGPPARGGRVSCAGGGLVHWAGRVRSPARGG